MATAPVWDVLAHRPQGSSFEYIAFTIESVVNSKQGSSFPSHVTQFEIDESVYGVRGTAGNTRDWCLDRFRESGPELSQGRLMMPTEEDLADPGFKSTRGGSYGNSASRSRSADRDWWFPDRSYIGRGLRVAWGLADRDPTDQ